MALISICANNKCWQRRQCYRWMQRVKPGIHTRILPPTPADGEPCDDFVAIIPDDRLKKNEK